MKLREVAEKPNDREKHIKWIADHWDESDNFKFKPGQFDFDKAARAWLYSQPFYLKGVSTLEVPIKWVASIFSIKESHLTSYKNFPSTHYGVMTLGNITTLKGFKTILKPTNETSTYIGKNAGTLTLHKGKIAEIDSPVSAPLVELQYGKLESVEGIHRYLPDTELIYIGGNPIKSSLLDLLKMPKLQKVEGMYHMNWVENGMTQVDCDRLALACSIIRTHLKGDRNLIKCQRDLLAEDLDEFA